MDSQILLGRGLHRFLFSLVRVVARDDLVAAQDLIAAMRGCGAMEVGERGHCFLNIEAARETVGRWLPPEGSAELPVAVFEKFREHWPVLSAWDAAGVALPLSEGIVRSHLKWVTALERAQLVRRTPRGLQLTILGRLSIWTKVEAAGPAAAPSAGELRLLVMGLRALRDRGRWHDAMRLANAVLSHFPNFAARHPKIAITAALGAAQARRYDEARERVALLRNGSDWNDNVPFKWRARLEALDAFAAHELGDLRQARLQCTETAALTRGNPERVWNALVSAWVGMRSGDYRRGDRLVRKIEASATGRPLWMDSVLNSWAGNAAQALERYQEAEKRFERAEGSARESGWEDRATSMLANRVAMDIDLGRHDQAHRLLHGLRRRFETQGANAILPKVYVDIGRLYCYQERPEIASWTSARAVALGRQSQSWIDVAYGLMGIANAARHAEEWNVSRSYYEEAREIAGRIGAQVLVGSCDFQLSRLAHYRGDTPRALRLLQSAGQIFELAGQYTRRGDTHRQAAEFLLELGLLDEAEPEIDAAEHWYGREPWARESVWVYLLRLELKLRRDGGSVTEADVEGLSIEPPMTEDYALWAHAIAAIGFAQLGDEYSALHFGKEASRLSFRCADLHFKSKMLSMVRELEDGSVAVGRLKQYWEAVFGVPTTGKETSMAPRRVTKKPQVGGDRWLSARQFNEIAAMVATLSDRETLTERILRFVKEQLNADRVAMFVMSSDDEFELQGALGAGDKEIRDIEAFSRGVVKSAAEQDGVTRIADAQADPVLSRRASVKRLNIRSVLAAPLVRQGRIMGLLYADTLTVPGAFVEGDHEILKGLAHLLAASMEQAFKFRDLEHRAAAPRKPGSGRLHFPGVVADSRRMQKILRLAMKIAKTDKTVIISGEPGTGKEVVADIIQQYSSRAKMPYLKVNCAAVPQANLESELFGVAAGAFTGVVAREGMFELANGGTLFLDEIGEIKPELQMALLRVLEERIVKRVGGKRMIAVDVRIIAATNTDLVKAVEKGKFRQDLFDRLNQFAIAIPPLREHTDDIPGLAIHFLEREREREHITDDVEFAPEVIDWFIQSPLPGNAREIANMVGKMTALDNDGILNWDDLPPDLKAVRQLQSPKFDEDSSFDNMMAIAEATILKRALDNANGRIRKAARDLNMPEATLRRRLKMLDLHLPTMIQMRRKPVRRKPRKARK